MSGEIINDSLSRVRSSLHLWVGCAGMRGCMLTRCLEYAAVHKAAAFFNKATHASLVPCIFRQRHVGFFC